MPAVFFFFLLFLSVIIVTNHDLSSPAAANETFGKPNLSKVRDVCFTLSASLRSSRNGRFLSDTPITIDESR